jgi:transcriptional regulator with XRE-family HTH domain
MWCMTSLVGPTLRRLQLAKILKRLRDEAGLSVATVTRALDCTPAYLYHVEGGRTPPALPTKSVLFHLLTLYGVTDPTLCEELDRLRFEANQRGWWSAYKLPPWLQNYIGLESDASVVRCYAMELVPGLLQTKEYVAAACRRHAVPEVTIERYVTATMGRQPHTRNDQVLVAVMSEAVLHRTLHMQPFGVAQLQHLVAEAANDTVDLRVLPFTAGGPRAMTGTFTLLDFPENVSPVAYREAALFTDMTDDPTIVSSLRDVFDDLLDHALAKADSVAFVADLCSRPPRRVGRGTLVNIPTTGGKT